MLNLPKVVNNRLERAFELLGVALFTRSLLDKLEAEDEERPDRLRSLAWVNALTRLVALCL